jgi:hypothetical protein
LFVRVEDLLGNQIAEKFVLFTIKNGEWNWFILANTRKKSKFY